jgi:hypothetical protein
MGKAGEQVKKRVEKVQKSPISMFWLSMSSYASATASFDILTAFFLQASSDLLSSAVLSSRHSHDSLVKLVIS